MTTAVDLFAGAGGLSLGLERAGARVAVAVEGDSHTAGTYRANHPGVVVLERKITHASRLTRALAERPDLLAGGPPCQGWSTLGYRARKDRREKHNAGVRDFLTQVKALRPSAVLFENVRGFALSARGRRLAELCESLAGLGYAVRHRLYRASDHGVPQLRHRLFVVAVRNALGIEAAGLLPEPTARRAPTLAETIGDLPELFAGESASSYAGRPRTALQRRLRGDSEVLTWHEAPDHAPHMRRLLGSLPKEGGNRRDLALAQGPRSGFHNTYARLRSNAPAPAVTGAIGRISSGRHAHPTQDRALTPREAARLQTFPDAYIFCGGRYSVYQQIGNAVPPDLAHAVAVPLIRALATATSSPTRS